MTQVPRTTIPELNKSTSSLVCIASIELHPTDQRRLRSPGRGGGDGTIASPLETLKHHAGGGAGKKTRPALATCHPVGGKGIYTIPARDKENGNEPLSLTDLPHDQSGGAAYRSSYLRY